MNDLPAVCVFHAYFFLFFFLLFLILFLPFFSEAVSVLMDHCPSLISNQCAIVEAAMRDNTNVVELLLEYGIDPNQLDIQRGSTALHEAVRFCRSGALG